MDAILLVSPRASRNLIASFIKEQPQRDATHGSRKPAAHDRSSHAHLGRHTFQHPVREALDKRRVPDAVEGDGARIEDNQLTGSDQFDWRR